MTETSIIESVVIGGDLSKLTPDQRVSYYKAVCTSLNLNPLTKPFSYITLNGKLTLYANKDAADQLRNLKNISIDKPEITFQDDWIIVTVVGYDSTGRKDSDVGVVNKKDMRGDFGNALMKAVTKAKRRLTLSICGLGMLDETEISSIPDARPVVMNLDTGEILPVSANVETPVKTETLRSKIYVEDPPDLTETSVASIPANLLSTEDVPEKMTVEHAQEVTSDKDGREYGTFTLDELRGHRIGLNELQKKDDLTPSKRAKVEHKLEAINLLIENFPK